MLMDGKENDLAYLKFRVDMLEYFVMQGARKLRYIFNWSESLYEMEYWSAWRQPKKKR